MHHFKPQINLWLAVSVIIRLSTHSISVWIGGRLSAELWRSATLNSSAKKLVNKQKSWTWNSWIELEWKSPESPLDRQLRSGETTLSRIGFTRFLKDRSGKSHIITLRTKRCLLSNSSSAICLNSSKSQILAASPRIKMRRLPLGNVLREGSSANNTTSFASWSKLKRLCR